MFCCLTASTARALLCMAHAQFRIQVIVEPVWLKGSRGQSCTIGARASTCCVAWPWGWSTPQLSCRPIHLLSCCARESTASLPGYQNDSKVKVLVTQIYFCHQNWNLHNTFKKSQCHLSYISPDNHRVPPPYIIDDVITHLNASL